MEHLAKPHVMTTHTAGGGACEGVAEINEVGVAQPPQDAHLAQHPLRLLGAAQHVRDALQRHLLGAMHMHRPVSTWLLHRAERQIIWWMARYATGGMKQ